MDSQPHDAGPPATPPFSGDASTSEFDASLQTSDASAQESDANIMHESDAGIQKSDAEQIACDWTENNALGPAYLPNAPFRTDLNVLNWPGSPLIIRGVIQDQNCRPIPNALIDIWQADDAGVYDGSAIDPDGDPAPRLEFPLRGRLYSGVDGSYAFTTLLPGLYPGRTRHIHMIVSAPGYRSLTTQIYFAGEARNLTDGLYRPSLEIQLSRDQQGTLLGVFDVALRA